MGSGLQKILRAIVSFFKKKEPSVTIPEVKEPAIEEIKQYKFDEAWPSDPNYLKVAFLEMGVSEVAGDKHNKRIIEYHKATTLKASQDEVPWCSSFMCFIMELAGYKSTRSAAARSWLNYGKKSERKRGSICVLKRPPSQSSGHVAFFLKESDMYVYLLGGNQDNKVCVKKYLKANVLDYRAPNE